MMVRAAIPYHIQYFSDGKQLVQVVFAHFKARRLAVVHTFDCANIELVGAVLFHGHLTQYIRMK